MKFKITSDKIKKHLKLGDSKCYYFLYTAVFLIVLILVFGWYFFAGKTFIYSNAEKINDAWDGYSQHYRAITYYSKYLRTIIKNIITNHQLIIPNWNFSIGEGADILGTLNYYVIGDPFTFLSVLVPQKYMWIYYEAIIIFRLYLAGIFFSMLCFKTGKKNKYAILSGALTYIFCSWSLINTNRHPYFLNTLVYFPLVILGVEKILKHEKPYLLIGAVFISAISNFYFFYMIAILTAIYTLVRLILLYKGNIKEIIKKIFLIGIYAVLGLLLSSIVLLPVCYLFLSDARMASDIEFNYIYPLSYYSKLPGLFLTSGTTYWMCMGYSAPCILAVFMLFKEKKRNTLLKVLFIICIIIMIIPFFGQILNGLSYRSNRWSWALALLVAYILVTKWENLIKINEKEWKYIVICLAVYSIICIIFSYSKTVDTFIAITIAIFTLIILCPIYNKDKDKNKYMLMMIILSIVVNGFLYNSIEGANYSSEGLDLKELINYGGIDESQAINEVAKRENVGKNEFRFSGRHITNNSNITTGISSTNYFWSISNSFVSEYRKSLEMRENINFLYEGYDDRTALNTLAGVLYYVTPKNDNAPVPYGFKYKETINNIKGSNELSYKVYENSNVLPLVYAYDSYIAREDWEKMNAIEKQEAMLQSIVLEENIDDIKEKEVELTSTNIPYDIKYNNSNVSLNDNKFVVTSDNSSITLNFEGLEGSETYLSIKGLEFEPTSTYDLYFGSEGKDPLNIYTKEKWDDMKAASKEEILRNTLFYSKPTTSSLICKSSNSVTKTLEYRTNQNEYYLGRHDFLLNFNYSESKIKSITITFSKKGVYSFDSINVICQPMNKYDKQIERLKENKIKKLKISTDKIKCKVTLNESKILLFAIPYSKGWEAYVDGQNVNILQANVKNMGIKLDKGTHNIELKYKTPLLKQGKIISFITLIIIFIICLANKRIEKNK